MNKNMSGKLFELYHWSDSSDIFEGEYKNYKKYTAPFDLSDLYDDLGEFQFRNLVLPSFLNLAQRVYASSKQNEIVVCVFIPEYPVGTMVVAYNGRVEFQKVYNQFCLTEVDGGDDDKFNLLTIKGFNLFKGKINLGIEVNEEDSKDIFVYVSGSSTC